MKIATLALALALAAFASAQTFVCEFDVAGLTCDACETTAREALQKIPGVTKAEVVYATRRARVEASRNVSADEIRRALGTLGFEAHFAGDPAAVTPLSADERAGLDIRVASSGEAFDVRKQLAAGKYTVIDFWAEWCGPCHVLTPKIERLVQQNPNVALRTVDLKQWDSGAAKQATKDFKIPGLPYVRVYGPDGKFVGEVTGNDIEKIKALVGGSR
ncbi:MAG: thioredoxin domain-containing protein [Acidobacteriota bacterium]